VKGPPVSDASLRLPPAFALRFEARAFLEGSTRGWPCVCREETMLFSLTMFPVGSGSSLHKPVADVVDEIDRAALPYELTGMDTVIEGDWDEVMPIIKRAEEGLRSHHERVFMVLTMDDHVGVENRLQRNIAEVESQLGHAVPR
jgi:uncharacterized protein (TIGR00106 family)